WTTWTRLLRLLHCGVELGAGILNEGWRGGHELGHADTGHVFARRKKEQRAGRAAPTKLADRARGFTVLRLHTHREIQPKSSIRHGNRPKTNRNQIVGQLVARHQLDRLRLEDSHTCELPTVEHHLGKPQIVVGCRDQSSAAGKEYRLAGELARG